MSENSNSQSSETVRILLVDDKESNLLSLETILEMPGREFVRAQTGQQALRLLLNDTDFALILMDVVMPGMDGFETARYIYERESLHHIPIIFLTARDAEDNLFKAYGIGAVDYLSKPINTELLQVKVNVFVELYRKNRILREKKRQLRIVNNELVKEVRERKAKEQEVLRLNEELKARIEELESLDMFTSSVSHDLRAPLTNVSAIASLLQDGHSDKLNDTAKGLVSRIGGEMKRLDKLIKDLLLFSRQGVIDGQFQETPMGAMVDEVVQEVKDSFTDHKYKLKVEEILPSYCNPDLMRQVWVNLIQNAVKYSSKVKNPKITLRSWVEGDCVIYEVRDNGVGFDMSESDKVFRIFQRTTSSEGFQGTGVGLALVKRILKKHKSDIQVESSPGKGARFWFALPQNPQSSPPEDTAKVDQAQEQSDRDVDPVEVLIPKSKMARRKQKKQAAQK